METQGFTRQLLLVLSGLIIWSVHFLIVYPFNAIACARGFATVEVLGVEIVRMTILCATVAALALIAGLLIGPIRGDRFAKGEHGPWGFLLGLRLGIGLLSAVAIILETVPVLMVPSCG